MKKKFLIFLLVAFNAFAQIDPLATDEVKELRRRLNDISLSINKPKQEILIGQQNAFHEGRGWRRDNSHIKESLKSDMEIVSGVHPAVAGFDFAEIGLWNVDLITDQMKQVHKRGGVVTLSWHTPSVIKDWIGNNTSNDVSSRVVKHILPGGKAHRAFIEQLDALADFFLTVKDIPIIFRPWHEHNFPWFWWGNPHCTKSEYIRLWRFTADYLMSKGVHNLLYAYSPISIGDYFKRYPGDNYVDILGVDHYFHNKIVDRIIYSVYSPLLDWKKTVIEISHESVKRDKIPAITEFGLESSHYKNFWTDYFGWPLEKEGMMQITGADKLPGKAPAFILLWRNDISDPKHYYGPIPGHANNENFILLLTKKIFQGLGP